MKKKNTAEGVDDSLLYIITGVSDQNHKGGPCFLKESAENQNDMKLVLLSLNNSLI
jgi:hypothetical protein